jgi:hypothetical protein
MENEPHCIEIINLTIKTRKFYKDEVNYMSNRVYQREAIWEENRFEELNKDEARFCKANTRLSRNSRL